MEPPRHLVRFISDAAKSSIFVNAVLVNLVGVSIIILSSR